MFNGVLWANPVHVGFMAAAIIFVLSGIIPILLGIGAMAYWYVFESSDKNSLVWDYCRKMAYSKPDKDSHGRSRYDRYRHRLSSCSTYSEDLEECQGYYTLCGVVAILIGALVAFIMQLPTLTLTLASIFGLLWLMRQIVRGGKKAMTKHVKELHNEDKLPAES